VATHAWPYAVSRDEKSGYQAVVVPEFLADAGQGYVLEYASKGQASEPATVIVRELRGTVIEPLSLVYRVTEARIDDGPSLGDDAPQNQAGRTVRVFEGLVLQMPAAQVASAGLSGADLDAVAGLAAPAFRKLWTAQTRVEAESSTAICIGGTDTGARPLDVRLAQPWVVPLGGRPNDHPREHSTALPGREGVKVLTVIVCVLAALLVWYLTRLMSESSAAVHALGWAQLRPGGSSSGGKFW
jgi:hypothetical protein